MLNRRHLRVKVLHYLYAAFQAGNYEIAKGEKQLLGGIEKVFELYIYFLSLIPEITNYALQELENRKLKMLPTDKDLDPDMRFANNKVASLLSNNLSLTQKINTRKISWQLEPELIKKVFLNIKDSDYYKKYMANENHSIENDKKLWLDICQDYLFNYEPMQFFFEDKSIAWADDFDVVFTGFVKTIQKIDESSNENMQLMSLYKDEEDDRKFVTELYRKTLLYKDEFDGNIAGKTENWDVERIAVMDILIMKMALTEAVVFPNIPTKVTLNEYIELAKIYSSPRSKVFVNGILDKLFIEFKASGKIKKTGRGLVG
jgi:N utilization substance protein B